MHPRTPVDRSDRFVAGVRQGVLPLLIWVAHFFVAYAVVAVGCKAGWDEIEVADLPVLTLVLLVVSLIALVWLVALSLLAMKALRRGSNGADSVPVVVRLGVASLALVGVLWATVPVVAFPTCSGWGTPAGVSARDVEFDDAGFDGVAAHLQLADRNRESKAPRTGTARVDVEHAAALGDRRLVRVA